MIQTPASGPLSPTTCPPMSWAEISILAASAALPRISANALALPAINRFNFMVRSLIMRLSLTGRASRPLWHTACHFRYFDQSLLLVEGRATAVSRFPHGEKAKSSQTRRDRRDGRPDRFQRRVACAPFGYLVQTRAALLQARAPTLIL